MLEAFRGLTNLLKYKRIHIDGFVFRLHYTLTVLLLLAFCVVITTKQFAGEPITCESHGITPNELVNSYCFIHSTYIVKSALTKKIGQDVIYPGIDKGNPLDPTDPDHKYQTYYQWVCFVLFIQALWFYLPRWVWKTVEGGKMKDLVEDLTYFKTDNNKTENKINLVVRYLISSRNLNDGYAWKYFACEIIALFNVIIQMIILDKFFDGEFLNYGFQVLRFMHMDPEVRSDPMTRIFPKLTKCVFRKFGASANIEQIDALCLLSINIINEKIFIFLWFWFYLIALLSSITIILRVFEIASSDVRTLMLKMQYRVIWKPAVEDYCKKLKIGDWLIISLLKENTDTLVCNKIMKLLSRDGLLDNKDLDLNDPLKCQRSKARGDIEAGN